MEQHQVAQSFGVEQRGRLVNHKEECRKRFEQICRETKEPRYMRAERKIEERLGKWLRGVWERRGRRKIRNNNIRGRNTEYWGTSGVRIKRIGQEVTCSSPIRVEG
jgi:hypothetical protein